MPHQYIFFLGSHPEISRAEVASVLQARGLSPTFHEETNDYVVVEVTTPLDPQLQDVLGGSDRFAQEIGRFPTVPTGAHVGDLLSPTPVKNKKINVGLSGVDVDGRELRTIGEALKEWWQEQGGKVRYIVPQGKATRLNAAQVMTHKLDQAPHMELTFVRLSQSEIGLYRTVAVQDIGAYELRDTRRPVRDAQVGLLPPKLAQIMLNLAGRVHTVVDPFCGMGTILQEGWLADYKMTGSDSSERMIRASDKNLQWLRDHFSVDLGLTPHTFVHQANTRWSKQWYGAFDAVVTEPLLGKLVKQPLPPEEVTRRMNMLGELYAQVFKVSWPLLRPGGVIVFALPAWRAQRRKEDWHLFPVAFLDALAQLGYSKHQLGKTERGTLLYARPDALVGRELTAWNKAG